MKILPDIEVDADKPGTIAMGSVLVLLLVILPLQIARWTQGEIKVSSHTGWENYMILVLALYSAVRTQDKGIRIISVLLACTQGVRVALRLAHVSPETWSLAGQGLALGGMVLEIGVLIGIAIWFKNRVRFVKTSHNA